MQKKRKTCGGFTLVEVIVVLVILAILAAILIPSMTGWIDKAKEKRLITVCRTCVTAAQTLVAEQYGVTGTVSAPSDSDIIGLAGVDGTVSGVKIDSSTAAVDTLTYADGTDNVTYYRLPNPHFEFGTGGGGTTQSGAAVAFAGMDDAFSKAQNKEILNSSGKAWNGGNIDGYSAAVEGTIANGMYNAMSSEAQAFFADKSWSIMNTPDGYRMFFTDEVYSVDTTMNDVTVYKYDFGRQMYQVSDKGFVKNGKISCYNFDKDPTWYPIADYPG